MAGAASGPTDPGKRAGSPRSGDAIRPSDALDVAGKRVVVLGLGTFGGGIGTARFFASRGARVLVTDRKSEAELAESLAAIADFDVDLRLGEHRPRDIRDADLVVPSPAVPRDAEPLAIAAKHGVPVASELALFFRVCPTDQVVGITGSNGKTTTTRLTGEIFRAGGRRVFVGGNVGGSVLERVDDVRPGDTVVLEISSFQAEDLDRERRAPACSVLLNVTPNHLDRHGTFEAYARAKGALLRHQRPSDVAVVCQDDPVVMDLARSAPGRVIRFGIGEGSGAGSGAVLGSASASASGSGSGPGSRSGGRSRPHVTVEDGRVVARIDDEIGPVPIVAVDRIRLLGEFNRVNVMAAAIPPLLAGVDPCDVASAIAAFRGVEHRLEPVGRLGRTTFYDDSIATTPESTLAALGAAPGRRIVIVGGYDKGVPTDDLVDGLVERAEAVALIGDTGRRLLEAIRQGGARRGVRARYCGDLETAVDWVLEQATEREGEASVLLSPGFASYDQFANFAERGDRFRDLVRRRGAWPVDTAEPPGPARADASESPFRAEFL